MSKITRDFLDPVWHSMLYSCTPMATAGVKGLTFLLGASTRLLLWVMWSLSRQWDFSESRSVLSDCVWSTSARRSPSSSQFVVINDHPGRHESQLPVPTDVWEPSATAHVKPWLRQLTAATADQRPGDASSSVVAHLWSGSPVVYLTCVVAHLWSTHQ